MVWTSFQRNKCVSTAILLSLLLPFVSSAEESPHSSETLVADSPTPGSTNPPLVRHMPGRFYRGPASRSRPEATNQTQPTYWQNRYQTHPSHLQTNNWRQQHVSYQTTHVHHQQTHQSGQHHLSTGAIQQPSLVPQPLWQQKERSSEILRMGAKQQRFPGNGQAKKESALHSTARPLFSWDDVPATSTPVIRPSSNAYVHHVTGTHSSNRQKFSQNNEENNIPRLVPNSYRWAGPRVEAPVTQPLNIHHNQATNNNVHTYQAAHYNRHRAQNNRVRPHYPYWLGADNQTKAAAQEIDRKHAQQPTSGTSTSENNWRGWNQRQEERRRADIRRRLGYNWQTDHQRPTTLSPSSEVHIIHSPLVERPQQPPSLRSRTAVNRGWFKVTNPSADVVFKLKPPVPNRPRQPVTSTPPSSDLNSYGYTVVPPHHQPTLHQHNFVIPRLATTETPNNVFFQENERLGINGMETRNQQGYYGKDILTRPETARPVQPKTLKPAHSDYSTVLKHSTHENEVLHRSTSKYDLKRYPAPEINVDNTPVVHRHPHGSSVGSVKVNSVVETSRAFKNEEVTCLYKNFQPAPSVSNSVIKYVRLVEPDGGDGGYVEAEYICNPGFRLVGVEQPARLYCRGKEWVGDIPSCESDPLYRRCSQNNGECQQDCKDDVEGRAVCSCKPGYILIEETKCEDINECSPNDGRGPCQNICENTQGSFRCKCDGIPNTVLAEDGHHCRREDECPHNHGCSHQCINTRGGPFCLCPDGYVLSADWKTCEVIPVGVKKNVEKASDNEVKSEEDVFVLTPKEDESDEEQSSEKVAEKSGENSKVDGDGKNDVTVAQAEKEREGERKRGEEERKREAEEKKREEEEKKREEEEKKHEEEENKRKEEEKKRKEEEKKREEEEKKREEEEKKREEEEKKREEEEKKREEEEKKREEEEKKREEEEKKWEEEEKKREEEEKKREEEEKKREEEEKKREDEEKKREEEIKREEEKRKRVAEEKNREEERQRQEEERKRGEEEQEERKHAEELKREEEERKREEGERKREEQEREREEQERKREEEEIKREEEERKREEEERKREEEEREREEEGEEEEEESRIAQEEQKREEQRRMETERKPEEGSTEGADENEDGEDGDENENGDGDENEDGRNTGVGVKRNSQEREIDAEEETVTNGGSKETQKKLNPVQENTREDKGEAKGENEEGSNSDETETEVSQNKGNEKSTEREGDGREGGKNEVLVDENEGEVDRDNHTSEEKEEESHEEAGTDENGPEDDTNGEENEIGKDSVTQSNEVKIAENQGGEEDEQEENRSGDKSVAAGGTKEVVAEKGNVLEKKTTDEESNPDGAGRKSAEEEEDEEETDNEDEEENEEEDEEKTDVAEKQTEDERREMERKEEQRIRQEEEDEKRKIREKEEARQRLDEERRRQREEEEEEERRRQREEDDDDEEGEEEEEEERRRQREEDDDDEEGEEEEGEEEGEEEEEDVGSEGEDREYIDDQPLTEENKAQGNDEPWIACPEDIVVELREENYKVFVQIPRPRTSENISWKQDVKSQPAWGKRLKTSLPVGDTLVRYIATNPSTGKTASCSVLISVKTPEAPKVTSCPQNLHLYAGIGSRAVRAHWEDPSFEDNVGIVRLHRTKAPGSRFPIGVSTVIYTATDAAGNIAQCSFEVNVHHA